MIIFVKIKNIVKYKRMKKYFEPIYWGVMVIILSMILMSEMETFAMSAFLSLMLLPGIMFVKFFSKDILFKIGKQEILNICYFLGIFVLIEYQFIVLVYWFLYKYAQPEHSHIILNPVFLCFILISMLSIEELIKMKLVKFVSAPENTYIKFTSDRIKVSLEADSILFIESNDDEVSVMTVSGKTYPTRMRISQWESVLDDRFLRIHRAFIVNRKHITTFNSKTIYIKNLPVEISRKYKTSVMQKLANSLND